MSLPTRLNPLQPALLLGANGAVGRGPLAAPSLQGQRAGRQHNVPSRRRLSPYGSLYTLPCHHLGGFSRLPKVSEVMCMSQGQRLRNKLKIPCQGPPPEPSTNMGLPPPSSHCTGGQRPLERTEPAILCLPASQCGLHKPFTHEHPLPIFLHTDIFTYFQKTIPLQPEILR